MLVYCHVFMLPRKRKGKLRHYDGLLVTEDSSEWRFPASNASRRPLEIELRCGKRKYHCSVDSDGSPADQTLTK